MQDASGERVDEHVAALEAQAEDHDHPHLDPSRWWFASSAFPMIAGTLGPVASAFSICALVRPWRQYLPPGTDIDSAGFVPDPVWLTVINAVQLVIAILSNFALLLNMTRRLSFAIAQPVTIIGWYISAFTLIGLTSAAAGPLVLQPIENYVWSQAFYYGIYSAILYFVVASLMVVTFLGAQTGHYPKDFILTPSQRTLMLQTIMFLMYLLIGALVFSNIEDWAYLDAVYWAAVTLFTVGFGDFYAKTTLGRALLVPYALVGIISLGLVIGSIRSLVLERGKRRFDARITERKRRQMLRRMMRKGKDGILEPVQPSLLSEPTTESGMTEFERRGEEFKLMRKIQELAARRRRWYAVTISGSTWVVLWLVGAKIFQECELPYQGWTYFEAFYFAFVSLTTIGYGDVTPVSNGGKSFWVFWALLALPTTTVLISNAGDTIVKGVRDFTDQIATVTILPGERGFKKDLKRILRTLSFGKLFEEEIDEAPAGFLGEAQRIHYSSEDEEDEGGGLEQDEHELEAEGAAPEASQAHKTLEKEDEGVHSRRVEANTGAQKQAPNRQITFDGDAAAGPKRARRPSTTESNKSGRSGRSGSRPKSAPNNSSQMLKFTRAVSMPRQALPEIPSNKADYLVTLAEEIGRVMQHLKSNPPRKYTFPEWAWYLRLIGEDEGDAERHRKAHPHTHRKDKKEKKDGEGGEDALKLQHTESWSWVGSRSPLMGSKEEAEWILEKLVKKLTEELRGVRRERRKSGIHIPGL
ncbi:outward-rectifier potassium channel TOK1 [Echria macrotheca]|uniref:Outward-rectifier potassium channel TOK1 n=1 Tax=Echria macrotheca TaxID=438768 RepID=A0AAJ0BJT7_9PEZI|nr:outward-rectifier potassium channel TOK1 [Echria macrotheca]